MDDVSGQPGTDRCPHTRPHDAGAEGRRYRFVAVNQINFEHISIALLRTVLALSSHFDFDRSPTSPLPFSLSLQYPFIHPLPHPRAAAYPALVAYTLPELRLRASVHRILNTLLHRAIDNIDMVAEDVAPGVGAVGGAASSSSASLFSGGEGGLGGSSSGLLISFSSGASGLSASAASSSLPACGGRAGPSFPLIISSAASAAVTGGAAASDPAAAAAAAGAAVAAFAAAAASAVGTATGGGGGGVMQLPSGGTTAASSVPPSSTSAPRVEVAPLHGLASLSLGEHVSACAYVCAVCRCVCLRMCVRGCVGGCLICACFRCSAHFTLLSPLRCFITSD